MVILTELWGLNQITLVTELSACKYSLRQLRKQCQPRQSRVGHCKAFRRGASSKFSSVETKDQARHNPSDCNLSELYLRLFLN